MLKEHTLVKMATIARLLKDIDSLLISLCAQLRCFLCIGITKNACIALLQDMKIIKQEEALCEVVCLLLFCNNNRSELHF